jgi:Lipase (class 3)
MPLFGKSQKRRASDSRPASSKASISKPTSYDQCSPPPPYQSPQLSHQHTVPYPYTTHPYLMPQQAYWQATVPYQYGPVTASSPYLPLSPPQSPPISQPQPAALQQRFASSTNLVPVASCPIVSRTVGFLNRGAALCDLIGDKFNDVISLIDDEAFSGNERDLVLTFEQYPWLVSTSSSPPQHARHLEYDDRPQNATRALTRQQPRSTNKDPTLPNIAASNFFLKATMYANSYLPPQLPPFRVYMPTWPLLCLAAQYSRDAYERPQGKERNSFVDADCRLGTKAMVIKSVPVDDMNTIVFAIRGTTKSNFMDWAVNLHTAPTSPEAFLDDPGNLCHGGFLDVARKMVKPVAARLRQLLEENPSRASCSLLITGHSAGGAIAALLYAHMLSETIKSELNILTGCFKRIHMVSFGAPPVSLLPLSKPPNSEKRLRKSLFLSFINEGDPVSRIEKSYLRSLLELYASPAPKTSTHPAPLGFKGPASTSKLNLGLGLTKQEQRPKLPPRSATSLTGDVRAVSNVIWKVPAATLSNAGRQVVLRVPHNGRQDDVRACIATDEQLRSVVFGDVMMHMMDLYARRIETLAKRAVTAGLKS